MPSAAWRCSGCSSGSRSSECAAARRMPLRRLSGLASVALAALLLASSPSGLRACGYHDDVAIARGVLNWSYPDALHVIGAISAAVMREAAAASRQPIRVRACSARNIARPSRSLERLARVAARCVGARVAALVLARSGRADAVDAFRSRSAANCARTFMSDGPATRRSGLVSGKDVIHADRQRRACGRRGARPRPHSSLWQRDSRSLRFLNAFKDVGRKARVPNEQSRNASEPGARTAAMQ